MKLKITKNIIPIILLFFIFETSFAQDNLISISQAATKTGANLYWDPLSGNGVFEKNGHHFSFRQGEKLVLLDFRHLAITDAPQIIDGTVYVTENFISTATNLFEQNTPDVHYRVGAILIDPGHGGKDPGAIGSYTKNGKKTTLNEKDITLKVSLQLADMLRNIYPDKKIIMTRSDDSWLSLEDRVEMANSIQLDPHEAILYVSIHVNASLNKSASGFEVWYLSPDYRRTVLDEKVTTEADKTLIPILNTMLEEEYTTESILIAKFILDGLTAQVGEDSPARGIKEEEWFVVRNANMPSVLVELGFVTNEKEAKLLDTPSYLRKLSQGIYNGLVAFVTNFERSRGFTISQ